MDTKVTVIIPVYGVEKYIERCARSLFNQTMKEGIEYIFVDDKTPDRSIEILERVLDSFPERKPQVKIIHHEKNRGIAAARNTGLKYATGEYIIHCDSDDWVEPDMYEKMVFLATKQNCDVVICDYIGVYETKEIIYKQPIPTNKEILLCRILEGSIHNGMWNKLIRKEMYSSLDSLCTEGNNMWEDVAMVSRLLYFVTKIGYVAEPLYYYNQTNISAYTKTFSEEIVSQIDHAHLIVKDFFTKISDHSIYEDSLKSFSHRALFSILCRVPKEKRKGWIKKYNLAPDRYIQSMPTINIIEYKLFLSGHNIIADFIRSLVCLIKTHVR